ncbi:MAG: ABC transporter ATP-binding protein [Oscillospiraceae bacterium]|nr:ABC transporter ATP-binding protein [Oscillospiraceae bacterium]
MIEIKDLCFSYQNRKKAKERKEIVHNLNLTVKDNEFLCLLGPSGCGKSTILKIIAGFEKAEKGVILDNGEEINDVSYERAMVFQEDAVFPWMRVYQNVEYGLKARGIEKAERDEIANHFISLVGLSGVENQYPKELSGGMKKRVDLARVLSNNPRIMLMDEPFGALDAMTKEKLQEQLLQIWEKTKKTIIFVTHDIEEAIFLGDRVAIMQPISFGGELHVYDIPFERPRSLAIKENPQFQKMRRQMIDELKEYESF